MDPTALSKALRGTRRLRDEEIAAIAKACGVSTGYLVEGTGPEPVLPPDTGRDRAQPVTAQERRDQILEAATVLIARHGYHNVRVSDIARYCGTSTATVGPGAPADIDLLEPGIQARGVTACGRGRRARRWVPEPERWIPDARGEPRPHRGPPVPGRRSTP